MLTSTKILKNIVSVFSTAATKLSASSKNSPKAAVGHPYHAVAPSVFPVLTSIVFVGIGLAVIGLLRGTFAFDYTEAVSAALSATSTTTFGMLVVKLISLQFASMLSVGLLLSFPLILAAWILTASTEELEGHHTLEVQESFRIGILLFITSEAMLFFGFFWAFFHTGLNPNMGIGYAFPPEGLVAFNWWRIPLLNTTILLSSGLSVTIAHALMAEQLVQSRLEAWTLTNLGESAAARAERHMPTLEVDLAPANFFVLDTVLRGAAFMILQVFEYMSSLFTIADSAYGSTFFALTGLHGLHVAVGAMMLLVSVNWGSLDLEEVEFEANENDNADIFGGDEVITISKPTTRQAFWYHSVGFDGAVWYWHFVDVVWLFVFFFVYCWSVSPAM